LRRAEPGASGIVRGGRAVEVRQRLAPRLGRRDEPRAAGPLADRSSSPVALPREQAAIGARVGRDPPQRAAGSALRQRQVGHAIGGAPGTEAHATSQRQAQIATMSCVLFPMHKLAVSPYRPVATTNDERTPYAQTSA
jgi:hypothetical protein